MACGILVSRPEIKPGPLESNMEYCQRIPLNPFIYPRAVSGNCSDPSELEPLEATWYMVTPSHLPHWPAV